MRRDILIIENHRGIVNYNRSLSLSTDTKSSTVDVLNLHMNVHFK